MFNTMHCTKMLTQSSFLEASRKKNQNTVFFKAFKTYRSTALFRLLKRSHGKRQQFLFLYYCMFRHHVNIDEECDQDTGYIIWQRLPPFPSSHRSQRAHHYSKISHREPMRRREGKSDLFFFLVKRQIKTVMTNVVVEHVKNRMSNAKTRQR